MPSTPSEIMDAFESVIDIFISDIRHRERAAFILCDNLVEMACKTKARQINHKFNTSCNFYDAWNAPGVRLGKKGLGGRVQSRRDTRNTMQHACAAATVDTTACADAILEITNVFGKLWGKDALINLKLRHKIALRIVWIYSSVSNSTTIQNFEASMRKEIWRGRSEERNPKQNEIIVESGLRIYWNLVLQRSPEIVEQILNSLVGDTPAGGSGLSHAQVMSRISLGM